MYYHGTSDKFLDDILKNGLISSPPSKLSARDGDDNLLKSYSGVYLANTDEHARDYADMAVKVFGGNPIVITVEPEDDKLVADEDHVIEFFANYSEDIDRLFGNDGFIKKWKTDKKFSQRVSKKVNFDMCALFGVRNTPSLTKETDTFLHMIFDSHPGPNFEYTQWHTLDPIIFDHAIEKYGMEKLRNALDTLCQNIKSPGIYSNYEDHSVRSVVTITSEQILSIERVDNMEVVYQKYVNTGQSVHP